MPRKTSMTEDSVEIARKSFRSSENPRKLSLSKGFRNPLCSSRKRRKVSVISSSDSNCSSPSIHSTLRPVTVKTWIQVASNVEIYRKLVEAGAKTSTSLANRFQRMFMEYFRSMQKYEESGTTPHREKSRIEKRNRLRSSKHKRKYQRKVRKLRQKQSKSDPGSAQLKFWVMEVLPGDEWQKLTVTHSALRKNTESNLFSPQERRRLEFVDAQISEKEAADAILIKQKFRPLTSIEKKVIRATMRLPGSRIVQSRFGIEMSVRLLKCLSPGVWLNDEVVNFWLGMIQERSNNRASSRQYPKEHQAKVFIMNTFFWTKLYNNGVYRYKNVRRWTKKSRLKKLGLETIFDLDKFLIPVHIGNTHWCAGVINFKKKRFEYYDSLGGRNEMFFKFSKRYLFDESRDKKGVDFCLDEFEDFCPEDTPQQGNGSDCGVFMLKFLEWACECRDPRGECGFSQKHMRYFRRRTLLEIIQSSLLEE